MKNHYIRNIIYDKRQYAVRFPMEVARFLKIDKNKDKFKFILDKNKKILSGKLIKMKGGHKKNKRQWLTKN